MPITSYEQYMDPVTGKGKVASYRDHRVDTEAAGGKIEWGVAVQRKSDNPDQVVTYAGGSADFIGVSIANNFAETRLSDVNLSVDGFYSTNDAVSVLRRGIIFVEVLEDVIKGNKAVVDNATGNFRPSTTTTAEISGVVGVFKESASAGGLAPVEINLP